MNYKDRSDKMNIEEIKQRLSDLEPGKVVEYDNTMNLATQYMQDYKNDVTFMLSKLELAQHALLVLTTRANGLLNEYLSNKSLTEDSMLVTRNIINEIVKRTLE